MSWNFICFPPFLMFLLTTGNIQFKNLHPEAEELFFPASFFTAGYYGCFCDEDGTEQFNIC